MLEEGLDEVAEEGLSVGGFAAEMAVFQVAACHVGWDGKKEDTLRVRSRGLF